MVSGLRRGWRRRGRKSRAVRIAAPLVIAVALGVTLGLVITSSGGKATKTSPSAASGSAPGVSTTAVNTNCTIIVPAHPLTARGLATPYQLTGPDGTSAAASGCQMINATNLGAFVQATILNPATGALSVYDPLVVTEGTRPAVKPVVPKLPRNAIVTIDFGFNGTNLYQQGATPGALAEGDCTGGEPGSVFGQVSFCNGVNFFTAAFRLMDEGRLFVPFVGTTRKIVPTAGSLGTGDDCPTTRNFAVVDQDPSDNVTTEYLLDPATGDTAQDTSANEANLTGATLLLNGSDNTLIDAFIDPTIGCRPFEAPDLGNDDRPGTSQALDELLAAKNQPKMAALVPENDEMVLDNAGDMDPAKTDLYREEVGQAPISGPNDRTSSPAMFCQNLVNIQTPFIAANQNLLATGSSPVPTVGDTLFTFLANRLNMSFTNLGCQNFGLTNPVTVTLDGNGAAIAATFTTTVQKATNTAAATMPTQGQRKGRNHHQLMNPAGM